jgi:hypothetical protein
MRFKGQCLLLKFPFVWKYFLSFFPNYEYIIFLRKKNLCKFTPFLDTGFVAKSVSTCVVSTNVAGLITTYNVPSKSDIFFLFNVVTCTTACSEYVMNGSVAHYKTAKPDTTAEFNCYFCTCRSKRYVHLYVLDTVTVTINIFQRPTRHGCKQGLCPNCCAVYLDTAVKLIRGKVT